MKTKQNRYANLALVLVAFVWGSGFVVTKGALNHITPYYLLCYRFFISVLILGIAFRKKLKGLNKQNLKGGFVIGTFMFLGFATQTVGLDYTTASKQAFITASSVVMVPFVAWATMKRKPDKFDLIGALFCFLGVGIISLSDELTLGYGEILSLIGAFCFALHTVSIAYYTRKNDPILLSMIQMFVSGIYALICAVTMEGAFIPLNKVTAIPILYLAIFSTFIAFSVQNVAQKHTSPTSAAMILSLEAVFGTALALVVLDEPFTLRMFIGFTLVFCAIMVTETKLKFLSKNSDKSGKKSKGKNLNEKKA